MWYEFGELVQAIKHGYIMLQHGYMVVIWLTALDHLL